MAEQEFAAVANAMIASWVDAWNRSDGRAYGDGYWQDAELCSIWFGWCRLRRPPIQQLDGLGVEVRRSRRHLLRQNRRLDRQFPQHSSKRLDETRHGRHQCEIDALNNRRKG